MAVAEQLDGEKEFGLGVLVVHGLSEPRRGSTLVTAADALRGCLDRWIRRDAAPHERQPAVTLDGVVLTADPDDARAPAHLTMSVAGVGERWCLAESWTTGDFQPPSLRALAAWALKIAPTVLLMQFAKTLRIRTKARPPLWPEDLRSAGALLVWLARSANAVVMFVVAALLSPLAIAVPLILLVLASLPVPKLSSAVRKSSARLAAAFGDSYVLLESPTRFAALTCRVEGDLTWLSKRARRVAVVALGQGAIITHRYLRRAGDRPVDLFVSAGSGLRKVEELRMLQAVAGTAAGWLMPILVLVFGASIIVSLLVDDWWWLVLSVAPTGVLMLCLSVIELFHLPKREEPRICEELVLEREGEPLPWVDVYASYDPVPNGPLFEEPVDWLQSEEIWSNGSMLTDHEGYWENPDGFVMPLARRLVKLADDPQLDARVGIDDCGVATARRRRACRLGVLVILRLTVVSAALYAGIRLWPDVLSVADTVSDNTPKLIAGAVDTVFTPIREPLEMIGVSADAQLAAGLIGLGALVAYGPVRVFWAAWNRRDVARFFSRQPVDLGGLAAALGLAFVLCLVGLLIKLGRLGSWREFTAWLDALEIGARITWAISLAFFGSLVMRWCLSWVERRRHATPAPDPFAQFKVTMVPVSHALVVGIAVAALPVPVSDGVFYADLFDLRTLAPGFAGLALPLLVRVATPRARRWRHRLIDWSTTPPAARA